MLAPWVIEEMKEAELEDKRLNERMAVNLDQLSGHPTASISAACGGYAETMAAYRFFDNPKVAFENILHPHIEATFRRLADHPVVILAQDTTELDFTRPQQQVTGAGPLDDDARYGALLHPLMGFTPDGTPLGTVYAEAWVRDDGPPTARSQREREYDRKHTPIEQKESQRWVAAHRQACEVATGLPETQFVCVADSEADIYELLQEAQAPASPGPWQPDWIIRAGQDRALNSSADDDEAAVNHLRGRVLSADVLFTQTITVRGRKAKVRCETRGRRQPRQSRTAEVQVRAARVTLRAPWRHDQKLSDVSVNVVLVTDVDPPEGDTPVEWMLLTSLPIGDAQEVRTVIAYDCVRWMIEVFFRTLKSGCRVPERLLEHVDRLLPCVAIYMIVAWRTLFVCRLGREFPEICCEAVFEPAEWKSVYHVVTGTPPPATPPTLQEMVRLVGQLGGYVNRPRSDDPGPQTIWLGLQRVHDIAKCWLTFGPEANKQHLLV